MKTHLSSPAHRGFTLIELLVVITIIVILAALSMGGYSYITRKQADSQAAIQISLLEKGLEDYKLDFGTYPPSTGAAGTSNLLYKALYWDSDNDGTGTGADDDQKIYVVELDPVNNKQGWSDGKGADAKIQDPYGNEYIYRTGTDAKNPDFDIISKGKDGTIGTPDDIDNIP